MGWGGQIDAYYAGSDLQGEGSVRWASDGPVPLWFDVAQDLTERWVHQMQMREAVDQVGSSASEHLPEVLSTFVWAFPNQYRPVAPASTCMAIDLGAARQWTLTSDDGPWTLAPLPTRRRGSVPRTRRAGAG